jgi:hypothetical protein
MPNKLTKEEFIEKARQVHGDKYNYERVDYKGNKIKAEIGCNTCGNWFFQTPNDHRFGNKNGSGCPKCSIQTIINKLRSTTEEFIEEAKKVHGDKFDYSRTNYISSKMKVEIGCKICNKFFFQTPESHNDGKGCNLCANNIKLTTEDFIEKAKKIHGDKFDYSNSIYINAYTKIEMKCNICNNIFYQNSNPHLNSHDCPKCAIKNNGSDRRSTTALFIEKATKIHGDKFNYDKTNYFNIKTEVEIGCNICGYYFLEIPKFFFKEYNCLRCFKESRGIPLNTKQFIEMAIKIHGDKYDYSKSNYKNTTTKMEMRCKSCKRSFFQNSHSHLNSHGCPFCAYSISKPEIEWLDSLNIKQRNVSLKINNRRFKVDGFNSETNTIYEFNGDYWHGNPEIYKPNDLNKRAHKTFGELYRATLEKENFIKSAGYNMISIWEKDWNELKKKL